MRSIWRTLDQRMHSHHRLVIALLGVLLVCIWSFIGFWSWWERASMHTSQGKILEQLTAAVQAQTKGLFKQAESTLITANQWIKDHPNADPSNAPEFITLVEKMRTTSGGLLDLRVVSRSGELRFVPDRDHSEHVQVGDRDYFSAHFDPTTRGLFIGQPILGRLKQKWFIPISAPVDQVGGTVAVLLVVVELDRIAESFDAERIKPAGTIGIVRTDGTVLFRSPLDPKTIGQSIAKGEAWSRFMSVLTKGSYESSVSIFDKLPRLVSFSRVDDYPLVVYVSASKNDMLQPWVFHTAILGGVAALVSLVSLLAGAALLHAMNASRVASAIIQSSDDAIVGKSLDGTITSWNPGAERIFGYTAKEMLGQPILRLLPHNRVHEESLIMEKIKNGQGVDHFETVRMRKDGSPINVSVTISPSVMNLAN